ncbi:hypothetical protein FGRMN_2796 [Fusarium graminum]|nr:hypothetical protein FGRMN_2796 [Fusarium graminum]
MPSTLVALILGAGPRVGASVARELSKIGYKVALVSKSGSDDTTSEGYLSLKADLANLNSIQAIFQRVQREWEVFPSVVIWNAGARTVPSIADDMFTLTQESLIQDININTLGPYVAAQEAVNGWKKFPSETKKTFIYTGNKLNLQVLPMAATATLGMGKSASSYWISLADLLYKNKGMKFYYADQRQADGGMGGMGLDGDAHGQFFVKLVQQEDGIPCQATFVPGTGYVKF